MKKEYKFSFDVYDTIDGLPAEDASLLRGAIEATKKAYAPYSNFLVGAKARLANGAFVEGTNQENASYPVGMCAERSLLATVATLHPDEPIETLAITYNNLKGNSDHPISPCGMCRQALLEYQARVNHSMRVILGGMKGEVYVLENAENLLPLNFSSKDMK